MRVYGNIMNRIAENIVPPIPTVGMGATILYYSDRQAGTVIFVSPNQKTIGVQQDKVTRI